MSIKISQLPPATLPLTGAELVPLVQSGKTVETAVQAIFDGSAASAGLVHIAGPETITGAKTFAAGLAVTGGVAAFSGSTVTGITSDEITYTQGGAGSVLRTETSKLQEVVSAKDYGAKGDGVTDDTAAINAALAANDVVILPPGTYMISGTLTMNRTTSYLVGSGDRATTLMKTTAGGALISIGAAPSFWGVRNLTLDRNVIAIAGGHGISAPNTTNSALISNVTVQRQFDGLALSSCSFGFIENTMAFNCEGIGVHLSNNASVGTLQWQLNHLLSQFNRSHGFAVDALPTAVGTATVGDWNNISTYANGGYGVSFTGIAGNAITNIRVNQMFLGGDGLGEINLNSHDLGLGTHIFRGINIELAGGNATGPNGNSIPATNLADGIDISDFNVNVIIDGFWINQVTADGIRSNATLLQLSNGIVMNSGASATAGRRNGIVHGGTGSLFMTNVKSGNTAGAGQQFGLVLSSGTGGNYIIGNDFVVGTGNSITNLSYASTATNNVIRDNRGYNPQGMTAIVVGPSPFTYQAGPTQENVFIQGGTITGINVGATAVAPTTNSIVLGPNQTIVVAYTAAPTMTSNHL